MRINVLPSTVNTAELLLLASESQLGRRSLLTGDDTMDPLLPLQTAADILIALRLSDNPLLYLIQASGIASAMGFAPSLDLFYAIVQRPTVANYYSTHTHTHTSTTPTLSASLQPLGTVLFTSEVTWGADQ